MRYYDFIRLLPWCCWLVLHWNLRYLWQIIFKRWFFPVTIIEPDVRESLTDSHEFNFKNYSLLWSLEINFRSHNTLNFTCTLLFELLWLMRKRFSKLTMEVKVLQLMPVTHQFCLFLWILWLWLRGPSRRCCWSGNTISNWLSLVWTKLALSWIIRKRNYEVVWRWSLDDSCL